ncbi:long-chain-fatty-acid--CoA ligase 1-like isoform X2 [Argiope bruennichi]|uniref:long-chain-fatty-acid--CoA ligase 1-like isoform X2 n=1 Tax=Argiope bruennichi TaxID=94029 RepID=UPI0024951000|nr:long-chain-fatty-acid--CoA ligase 1-like isoform X2 [Argiope bruennichi]
MSVQRALFLQKRVLVVAYSHFFRGYCFYAKQPYRQKPVTLSQQSVLLPGLERIRSSVLLEDPNKLVAEIPGSPEVHTVYDCLRHGEKVSNNGPCVGSKNPASGEYEWLSYSEVISRTQAIGSGLIHLGLKPQNDSFVGIFAVNQQEFLLTLYGCSAYSMVVVPLYLTLGLQSVLYIINQARLSVVIADSEENALKVLRNVGDLPSLKSLVIVDPVTPQIQTLAKERNIRLLQFSALVLPKSDDLFCIPYTSGTTGMPKGVMLTHRSMIACVASLVIGYGEAGVFGGTIMSYLPPAHIYEICNEVASLYFARSIAFYSGDVKKLMDEVRILKPNILPLVPRIMNALYTRVKESVEESAFKSFLLRTALSRKQKLLKRGKVTNQSIWDKLVLKKFQEALGGNVHMIITTSAPISPEIMFFFRCGSGAYVFEAYGQTETLASSMTLPLEYEGGNTGGPLPCNFIKLKDVPEMGYFSKDDFGEVCMKGPTVFIGYFKNEKATQESLIDGWQHSGDIGRWLPNGALKIVDRKKHLFKLSQGEYIAPEKIETVYSQSKLVAQIFVDGHSDQNYVIALVLPEPSALKDWLRSKGYKEVEDINQLLLKKEVRKSFLVELRKIGDEKELNHLEQAKNLAFLSEPLSVENDLMSPTLKVRRGHARKHFESLFDSLYKEGPLV